MPNANVKCALRHKDNSTFFLDFRRLNFQVFARVDSTKSHWNHSRKLKYNFDNQRLLVFKFAAGHSIALPVNFILDKNGKRKMKIMR